MLPTFYHPRGKPLSDDENNETLSRVKQIFNSRLYYLCRLKHFSEISKAIGLPLYARKAVYEAVCRCSDLPPNTFPAITFDYFVTYWSKMIKENHDQASRFIFTISVARTGLPRTYLEREDFLYILEDIVQTHPALSLFSHCGDLAMFFRQSYVELVLTRIFWNCSRAWWTGRLTAEQLRRSNFLELMNRLEGCGKDLPGCFNYEHFYVAYSKFWELDEDHDMKISQEDLKKYANGTLTDMIIKRIFSDVVRPKKASTRRCDGTPAKQQNMEETIGFEEFVAFLMAEEDKLHPTAIEYWFRCLDLDGDGILSPYEMEFFYNDTIEKMSDEDCEPLEFHEFAIKLYYMVSPQNGKNFTLRDIKQCGLARRFYNALFNPTKYLHREFAENDYMLYGEKEASDWDKFCEIEYKMLVLKEAEDEEE